MTSEKNVPLLVAATILGLIGGFVLLAAIVTAIHRIHEGCVGLYFKNGALLDAYSPPGIFLRILLRIILSLMQIFTGIHWAQPFVTTVEEMKIRPETKVMDPMVCTTRDGVKNVFRDIQIISSINEDHVRKLTI